MTQAIDKAEMLRQNLADDKCSKQMTEKCIRFAQKGLHSCYFSKDAYANMIKDSKYADNKELLLIEGAVHTDLYDGGENEAIPFDKLESFYTEYLK